MAGVGTARRKQGKVVGRQRSSAGAGVQVRAPRANAFSPAKQERFFAHLSETANVRASARHAEISVQTVWDWRHKDAAFLARWQQALAQGYADLEMQMIGKAMFGVERETVVTRTAPDKRGRTRKVVRTRSDSPGLGPRLLDVHRAQVVQHHQTIQAAMTAQAQDAARVTDAVLTEMRQRLIQRTIPHVDDQE